jgi:protein SCO1/2
LRRAFSLSAALATLVACTSSAPSFHNADITGADYGKDFALTDHTGRQRTLADFRGRAVVVFFGYIHCPDVCPTTMLELKQALQLLGEDSARVQVLFITVDPERDTPALLAKYVPGFDPSFIGLYGDMQSTAKVAKDFRVFYQKAPGQSPESYTIDHTAASYVFDSQGRLRLFVRPGRPDDLAADLRALLGSSG